MCKTFRRYFRPHDLCIVMCTKLIAEPLKTLVASTKNAILFHNKSAQQGFSNTIKEKLTSDCPENFTYNTTDTSRSHSVVLQEQNR